LHDLFIYYTANHFPVTSDKYPVLAAAFDVSYSRLLNPDGCSC